MRRLVSTLSLALLVGCLWAAPASAQRVISGEQAARQATALTTQIHWHHSLDAALAQARREGKPVVWIHMLGSLEGYT